jgi:uncharacterized protein (UPF0332 family)
MQPQDLYDYASDMYQSLNSHQNDKYQLVARNIVGRAYYAALLMTSNYLRQPTVGKDGHKNVTDALKQENIQLGNALDQARLLRQKADYKLNEAISQKEVISQLKTSKQVIDYILAEQSK